MREITYLQAVQEAFREEMRRDPRVFMMGEDLRANLFGAAGGFVEEFGLDRFGQLRIGRKFGSNNIRKVFRTSH